MDTLFRQIANQDSANTVALFKFGDFVLAGLHLDRQRAQLVLQPYPGLLGDFQPAVHLIRDIQPGEGIDDGRRELRVGRFITKCDGV